jgi:hypothetical protein
MFLRLIFIVYSLDDEKLLILNYTQFYLNHQVFIPGTGLLAIIALGELKVCGTFFASRPLKSAIIRPDIHRD